MTHTIGIVAHRQRTVYAQRLATQTNADHIGWDNGQHGPNTNHKRVWEALLRQPTQWCITLEDDALPIENFNHYLTQALQAAPTPIISLYLGQQRPPQHQTDIAEAIEKAQANNAAWITSDHLYHAVAVAIQRDLLPEMLTTIKDWLPIDEAIGHWARHAGHQIAYTVPSLVDHNDTLPTLITHRDGVTRPPGRIAWHTGGRTNYDTTTVTI